MLERLAVVCWPPHSLVGDHGPEFVGLRRVYWASEHGVAPQFIYLGHPIETALIESFNGAIRDECPNVNWIAMLRAAQQAVEAW